MHFVQSKLECESLKEAGGESEAASANLMRLAILILLIQFVEKPQTKDWTRGCIVYDVTVLMTSR